MPAETTSSTEDTEWQRITTILMMTMTEVMRGNSRSHLELNKNCHLKAVCRHRSLSNTSKQFVDLL